MIRNIIVTTIFILAGLLLIRAAREGYKPLMDHWLTRLLTRLTGNTGPLIFYYITGIIIILLAITRLIYTSFSEI